MSYRIKGKPFEYKGTVNVQDCTTSEEVMIKAGLDWEVTKCELFGKMPGLMEDEFKEDGFLRGGDFYSKCPNSFGIYRTDHNIMIGNVKAKYTPVQNKRAFEFFDGAICKDKAIWQSAGAFGIGEKVFVSAKLPRNILVGGKDPIENYLVFMTSHDGSMGVRMMLTPIRISCQNTLNTAWKHATNYISFRHTSSVHDNMDRAAELLGITNNMIYQAEQMYTQMSKVKMTDKEALEQFSKIILTENELNNIKATGHTLEEVAVRNWRALEDANISTRKANTIISMNDYYFRGIDQQQYVGTAWGVYGAITGYYSNVDNTSGEKRMDTLLFGDRSRKMEMANNNLMLV